jgi:hypothetical protein
MLNRLDEWVPKVGEIVIDNRYTSVEYFKVISVGHELVGVIGDLGNHRLVDAASISKISRRYSKFPGPMAIKKRRNRWSGKTINPRKFTPNCDLDGHFLDEIAWVCATVDNYAPINHKLSPRDHNPENRFYDPRYDLLITHYKNSFKPFAMTTPKWDIRVMSTFWLDRRPDYGKGVYIVKGNIDDILADITLWKLDDRLPAY